MENQLKKLYEGSLIEINLIKATLEEASIEPIVKDHSESGRLAGFAGEIPLQAELFVFEDQFDKAEKIMKEVLSSQ